MIITYDFGHGTGGDRGAQGYLNEEKVCREYGALVIKKLTSLGHTCYNCTPPEVKNGTLIQSLAYRVNKANSYKSDLHLCFHVNSYATDVATGCEVEYYSSSGKVYAEKISKEISKALDLTNRGAKQRKDLYILKNTNMTAVLIEPFFCSTLKDCNKYNAEKLSDAIVYAITGKTALIREEPIETTSKYDETPPKGNNIFSIPNTDGYIEQASDGRLIIHKDRGNYISIGKGFIDLYWNDNKGNKGRKRLST
jgi:N-acetylmuramoyl-L-alanine amidase